MPTIMLTGDQNFPLLNWELESVYGEAGNIHTQKEVVLNFGQDFCLHQASNTLTKGNNILDIVITNNDDVLHNITVNNANLLDHNIIILTTSLSTNMQNRIPSAIQQAPNFSRLNFHNESVCWVSLKRNLSEVNWDSLMKDCDPEAQYDILTTKCLEISEKYVPLRRLTY